MYGIIVNKDGSFYKSVIFGDFCPITAEDEYQRYLESIFNRFYIVLNEEKTRLVKKYVFDRENSYLNPLVLITDSDTTDWIINDNDSGCIDFLNNVCSETEEINVNGELLEKCIDIDKKFIYNEYPEVKNQKDIDNLLNLTGWFHDAYIEKYEETAEGELYVLFDGIWGCKTEIWFKGDVSYNAENESVYWFDSSLFIENGFIYLIEGEDQTSSGLCDEICWFKARSMKYHVIPNDSSEDCSAQML